MTMTTPRMRITPQVIILAMGKVMAKAMVRDALDTHRLGRRTMSFIDDFQTFPCWVELCLSWTNPQF